jgi:hypothetical protein
MPARTIRRRSARRARRSAASSWSRRAIVHAARLLAEGNTDEGFESAFDVLGNVGMFMAACRRHEITNPDRERKSPLVEASALAMHLGASLGMSPRFLDQPPYDP